MLQITQAPQEDAQAAPDPKPQPPRGLLTAHLRVDVKYPAVLSLLLMGLMHQGLAAGDGHAINGLSHHQDLTSAALVLSQQPRLVRHQPLLPGGLLPQLQGLSPLYPLLQLLLGMRLGAHVPVLTEAGLWAELKRGEPHGWAAVLPGLGLVQGHHLCMLQGRAVVLKGLLGVAGDQAGVAVQAGRRGLAVGDRTLTLPGGGGREQVPPLEPVQLLGLPHGHLHRAVSVLTAGCPVPARPPAPHVHAVGQGLAVLRLRPHLHDLLLAAALGGHVGQERRAGSVLGAAPLGVHGAEAWRTAPEAVGTQQLEVATVLRTDGIRRAVQLAPGLTLQLSLEPQTPDIVLTLEGPDQRLLRTAGKGALVVMALAADARPVVPADFIAGRPWEAGPAVHLVPEAAPGGSLEAGQQDLSGTPVLYPAQEVGTFIEPLTAAGAGQAQVQLGAQPGQRQLLGGHGAAG